MSLATLSVEEDPEVKLEHSMREVCNKLLHVLWAQELVWGSFGHVVGISALASLSVS